ncbi:hypothetical protein LCGC14_2256210 [marine sediment metagenome]|uniref:Uncharacterized protein n=1 Tax=marine sediment metagenome TaxID=412755 RepID=A0A0F9FDL5_9ZZZZ
MSNQCDQCEAMMINGVYCHEIGCPNIRKNELDNLDQALAEFEQTIPKG